MESFAQRNHANDDDDTYNIFRYFSGPSEHSDRVEPPKKRTKLDDQNWLPIDKISKVPGIEQIGELTPIKLKCSSTSCNDIYSSKLEKDSSSESQSCFSSFFQDIGDVQRSVINIIKGAPETPVFSTDILSSYEEKQETKLPTKSISISKELTPKVFRNYILYPPDVGIIPKPTTKRPPGCKTVRITGLPMSMSPELLKEVFGNCGNICNFSRKTEHKGSFCVTYSFESSIDKVLELNGYTLVCNSGKEVLKGELQVNFISVLSNEEKLKSISKELTPIVFRNYILYPPAAGTVLPKPTTKRLPGCKTVRITGLPMSMSPEMLKEVFGTCGNICNFNRKTKQKGAFRVTYSCESSIDRVFELNGYTLVFNSDKEVLKGEIQVHFISILPQKQQSSSQTVVSQKEEINEPILIEPQCDPSNVERTSLEFSIENAGKLMKKMHGYNIVNASNQFIRWIEQGECNESNCICFLHLLNSMRIAASKRVNDTAKLEVNILQHKDSLIDQFNGTPDSYFEEILKVFNVACSQTVLNSFTLKMRKRILEWRKNIINVKESHSQEWSSPSVVADERANLSDLSKTTAQVLQAKQLIEHKIKLQQLQVDNERLQNELKLAQEPTDKDNGQISLKSDETESDKQLTKNIESDGDNVINTVDNEAWLIAMIGAFLNFHRFGETIESICQYLLKFDPTVTSQNIECLMRKFPTVFKEESVKGVDDLKTKWTVLGI